MVLKRYKHFDSTTLFDKLILKPNEEEKRKQIEATYKALKELDECVPSTIDTDLCWKSLKNCQTFDDIARTLKYIIEI